MSDYKQLCQEFIDEIEKNWSHTIYTSNMLDIYCRALEALNRKLKPKAKTSTVAGYINRFLSRGDQS